MKTLQTLNKGTKNVVITENFPNCGYYEACKMVNENQVVWSKDFKTIAWATRYANKFLNKTNG